MTFEEFYRQEYPNHLGRFCNDLGNKAEAEDMAQELFLRVYRSWDGPPGAAYMNTAHKNALKNRWRKQENRPTKQMPVFQDNDYPEEVTLAELQEDPAWTPDLKCEMKELVDSLQAAGLLSLARLRSQGYSVREMANSLNMGERTVHKRLREVRALVRDRLSSAV